MERENGGRTTHVLNNIHAGKKGRKRRCSEKGYDCLRRSEEKKKGCTERCTKKLNYSQIRG